MDIWLQTVLTFLAFVAHISGWRPFTVQLKDFTYEIFHPEVVDFNVTMKNVKFFDVHINFARDIAQSFIDLTVLHDSGDGKFDMVYMNKTIDVCQFLLNKKTNIFFDMVYKIMSEYVELPKKCPIRKKKYSLSNVFFDPEKFPPFMPDHKAKVSILGWQKENGAKMVLQKTNFKVILERSYQINGSG